MAFYRIKDDYIEVIRIIYEKRDYMQTLFGDNSGNCNQWLKTAITTKGAAEMKEMNIPVGVSDFEEIRKNGYYYIDKSGLIGELLSRTGP